MAHVTNTIFTQVKPMWFLMSWEEGGVEMNRENNRIQDN